MAKQKYTFPKPYCPGCPYHETEGTGLVQTRYCNGFPKKRKARRFRKSDPKYKPPKWCPRLISPPACRVYGFADEEREFLDWRLNRRDYRAGACIVASASRYRLRCEMTLGLTARQFYDAAQKESMENLFFDVGVDLEYGEVIEIDDGLNPYYFYYLNYGKVIPLTLFDRSQVQAAPSVEGGGQG